MFTNNDESADWQRSVSAVPSLFILYEHQMNQTFERVLQVSNWGITMMVYGKIDYQWCGERDISRYSLNTPQLICIRCMGGLNFKLFPTLSIKTYHTFFYLVILINSKTLKEVFSKINFKTTLNELHMNFI